MKKRKLKIGIMAQVALTFVICGLVVSLYTFYSQYKTSNQNITELLERQADRIAEEVMQSVWEYPAHKWLVRYWYEHADSLDIEYDADFSGATATEEKCRILNEKYPQIQLRYADEEDILSMDEEDQKRYAEIAYSWLITHINQIKRSNEIDFLYCIVTNGSFNKQFFLFSAADEGAVRSSKYEDVYPLGVTVDVSDTDLPGAMRSAVNNNGYLADTGKYVDYYDYYGTLDDKYILIGITYNLSGMHERVRKSTINGTVLTVVCLSAMSVVCLGLILSLILIPLKEAQQNIRLYKKTKDSETIIRNLGCIRSTNEIGQLSEDIIELAKEIDDYTVRIQKITSKEERINAELEFATRIQSGLLPGNFKALSDKRNFDIFASMTPAREVGGDFYDFDMIDDDHLYLAIADVSGKGIPAAMVMMASQIVLQSYAKNGDSPAQILTKTNRVICDKNREEMFVTAWVGILELSTGKLTAANAGHEYPVLIKGGTAELYKDKHGFVLGGIETAKYTDYELTLSPGDKLFVYTDGVPEATNRDENMFGTERMLKALNTVADESPEKILHTIHTSADAFVNNAEQFDDLTMMCIEYQGDKL